MHAETSSPGVSGQERGQCRRGLTTRDGERQEAPGARTAGTGGRGPAEKLSNWEAPPVGGPLNLFRRTK